MDRAGLGYLPAVAFASIVLVVSLIPAPETGGPAPTLLGLALDKWLHAGSYATLTALLAWGYGGREGAVVAGLVAVAVCYGGAVELLQTLVPSRGTSVLDLLANTVGAVSAGLVRLGLARRTG